MLSKLIKKPTKAQIYRFFRNNILVVIGTCVLAFGTGVFLVPCNLVTGGLSGIAIVVKELTGGILSVDLTVTILQWAFFFLGVIFLNRSFALQTLASTIVYPVALALFMRFPEWFSWIDLNPGDGLDVLLAALFGGMLVGAGCAITFQGGGSTGGVDILAFIICKYQKKFSASQVMFAQDAIIVIFGIISFKSLETCLIGVLSALITSIMIDKMFVGKSKEFVAFIVSDKHEEIYQEIARRLDRTATYIDAVGAYSRESKQMVMVSFTMNQYSTIIDIVSSLDKKAFITISRAHEIKGEGFKPISPKEEEE